MSSAHTTASPAIHGTGPPGARELGEHVRRGHPEVGQDVEHGHEPGVVPRSGLQLDLDQPRHQQRGVSHAEQDRDGQQPQGP
ncbi:hypothetical protein G6009_12915, partial [Dietzia sp. SLG510A3-30A2]|nr:hypothetical protein [Dietzia sp. SLG510A3-30A2]